MCPSINGSDRNDVDDDDDDKTSTQHSDVESPIKSPTNNQQRPTHKHVDQQRQQQSMTTTSDDHELRHSITTTTNDNSNHDSNHRVGHHLLRQPVGSSPGQAHLPVCAPPERRPFSGVPKMALELRKTDCPPRDIKHSSSWSVKAPYQRKSNLEPSPAV